MLAGTKMVEQLSGSEEVYQSEYCILRQYARRHKDRREWCWRFSMHRQDQRVIRVLFDLDYGSPEAGLEAARAYRTAFMEAFPPVTNLQRAQKIRSSNKSGIPGVYLTTSHGKRFWRASVTINGKERARAFSVDRFGEDKAKELAIAERQELLKQFDPNFLRVPDEAQEVAEAHFPEYLQEIPEPKSGKWMDDEEFKQKLAEIDAQFAPRETRARRLYVRATLLKSGKVLNVFISNWQQHENYLRGFGVSGDIAGPLAKARVFIAESIEKMHGKKAADNFMDAYGNQFYPDTFGKAGKFQERLIESRDEKTGKPVWRPPVEKKPQS